MNKFIITCAVIFGISAAQAGDNKSTSFITGVGSTAYEAQRMAFNAAVAANATIHQQTTSRNADGTWQIIMKVTSK